MQLGVGMELEVATKIVLAVLTAIGSYVSIILNSRQANNTRAELLEKFEVAMEKEDKHSATELFRLLHGFRMNYSDVVALTNDDKCSKLIALLKSNQNLNKYITSKDGQFVINTQKKKLLDTVTYWVFLIFSLATSLVSLYGFFISEDLSWSITGFIFFVVFLVIALYYQRESKFNRIVEDMLGKG